MIVKMAPKLNLSHQLLNKRFGRKSGRQTSSAHGALQKCHQGAVLGAVESLPIVYQMTSQSGVLREEIVDKPKFLGKSAALLFFFRGPDCGAMPSFIGNDVCHNRNTGVIQYKISCCATATCNCFYIRKLQQDMSKNASKNM